MDLRQKILRDLMSAENDAANVQARVAQLRYQLSIPHEAMNLTQVEAAESWSRDLMTFGNRIESMGDELIGHVDELRAKVLGPVIVPVGRDDVVSALNDAEIDWRWADA
jgi:hypothetical protein